LLWTYYLDQVSVDFLIRQGANINIRDHIGYTPLHHASSEGFGDIVELLLTKGAVFTTNNEGETPLDLAEGYPDVVQILEKYLDNQLEIKEPD
jgi:uncharacterized protein